MDALWPWLTIAGLGAFHGANPAMGWLFAVALGMHRGGQRAVLAATAPIAVGHAASIAIVVAVFYGFAVTFDGTVLRAGCGALLIAWAVQHAAYGHGRWGVRVGMQASSAALAVWSFMMATAHGAGLMLIPALGPICLSGGSGTAPFAAVGVHTGAMLLTTSVIAVVVYRWAGLAFLRGAWVNLDWLWGLALTAAGGILIAGA